MHIRMPSTSFIRHAALGAALVFSHAAWAAKESSMNAQGTFDVKVTPKQPDNDPAKAAGLGRLALHKTYHGPLEAVADGEMLAYGDGKDAGAYVAIEKVTGTLDGRKGSFALMHRSGLRGGKPENWSVTVVPESGTDELRGLEGELVITIEGGVHHYALTYTLP